MEEDVGIKGTVTRLRRRLSVEKNEDVSSPSTPTKKRGGRLAAKPQLELIDENAKISSPKKPGRKSLVKDMTDAEEKPVTPSRRSIRIKSNTSIVSETVSQTTDSPRARRALRRTSQAGSDNEGPATPVRQTRRTRKDSASSVENQEPAPSRPLQVVEMVIAEEPEIESANKSKSSSKPDAEELSPARKSKRLLENRNRRSGSHKSDHELSTSLVRNKSLNTSGKDDSELKSKTKEKSQDSLNKSAESKELNEQLSELKSEFVSLLKTLDTEPKINHITSNHNKSVPSLDNKRKKRNRTESWPVARSSPANDNIMFSDNEQAKKKRKKSGNNYPWMNNSGSSLNNTSIKEDKNKKVQNDNNSDLLKLIDSPLKRKERKSETSVSKEEKPPEPVQLTEEIASKHESSTKKNNQKSEIEDVTHYIKDSSNNADNTRMKSENNGIPSEMAKFFETPPSNVTAIVYFEDSDSNNTTSKTLQLDSEDQCVPVVKHDIKFQEKISPLTTDLIPNEQKDVFTAQPIIGKESCNNMNNQVDEVDNSCEPMDIDETIHEEILQKSLYSEQDSIVERKSSSQRHSISEEPNKSKRKSSITANDTSKIENKSTLILSQLKDVSKTSDSVQSPKAPTSEILSKSTTNGHENTKKVAKGNLSLNDLKGTPLKQTNVLKLNMQTSTPIATEQIDKIVKAKESASPKKNSSNFSESIDKSLCSEEDSNHSDEGSCRKNDFIDGEAEEASNDYESGDSRNEEERKYEEEHEIIEQGETLGSEEDVTNDSDYEKDSFIVSSDAEDDDLLSGSGDDLAMSDKELSMSKKSKNKYNERKLKEQKNASREMYESRHKLNTSEKQSPAPKTKNNRMRIDSSLLESDEEIVVKPKKSKRLRLDSTLDTSNKQDAVNESLSKSNKKSNKSMQKSICNESALNEKELTICKESLIDNSDPLQVQFKQEPKTPQKDLDMSVVQFTTRQDIENVEVDEGKSILNQTEIDPLQTTMAGEDTSDSSENEEIMQNYDSILNELNKNKKVKLSNNNLSLNMDKKAKMDKNEPILDQLNLTHSKRSKKIAKEQSQDVVDSKTPGLAKIKHDSDSLSDSSSIDLKLLFSEDNCESDDNQNKKEGQSKIEEMFVPLRKSTGKTDIVESGDNLFFIDTTGAQDKEIENAQPTETDSGKKKKKKKHSAISDQSGEELVEAPVEVIFITKKKKQKKDKLDTSQNKIETNENIQPAETESAKKKKKKKHSAISDQPAFCDAEAGDVPVEAPYKSEKDSNLDAEMQKSENTPSVEIDNMKIKKKKKKKQSTLLEQSVLFDEDSYGAPEETPYQSEKATDLEENQQIAEPSEPGSGNKKKKKKKRQAAVIELSGDNSVLEENSNLNSNKRKRKSSDPGKTQYSVKEGAQESLDAEALNDSLSAGRQKKKRKISNQGEAIDQNNVQADNEKKKKKNCEINFQNTAPESESTHTQIKKNKKRKERDEDIDSKNTKVSKHNSLHDVHMPPLPDSILNQLDDRPRKNPEKLKAISTSTFVVENARQKRAKPSKYLEESVYLDANSPLAKKDKSRMKKPKVLPFIPTASISDSGFTTNFQIKKMSQNVEFIAGPAEMTFSKETYLQKREIKRLGTYDHYKKQISRKLSKF